MTAIQAFILGIIQGFTEFLPISSSGHLVIAPYLLGWEIPQQDAFIFDVLVQVASLFAVFAYFWIDIKHIVSAVLNGIAERKPMEDPSAKLGWLILLATIPAALIGLLLKDLFEKTFSNPLAASIALLVTAGLLIVAEKIGNRVRSLLQINWKDALWIGIFQIFALFPGVSRSGTTITGGMIRNLDRHSAARFSFLMSIPVMLAAGFIASIDLLSTPNFASLLKTYFWGFLSSAIVGYLAIRWLIRYLTNHSLYIFSIYCSVLAIITILVYVF